jgi:copper transport protein
MTADQLPVVLTVLRFAGYAGFVLWSGPLLFWTLVWPTGIRHRRLLRLSGAGALLLILTSVAEPAIRLTAGGQPLAQVAPPLGGTLLLVRLAILVGSLFYLVDLVSGAVVGGRRALALAAIVVVAATLAAQPAVLGRPSTLLTALSTLAYLLAAGAWLGGLIALAAVARADPEAGATGGLVTRFSSLATLALALLVLAGGLALLAAAGGGAAFTEPREGQRLLVPFGLYAAVLAIAWYAHRVTARLAFRRLFSPSGATGSDRDRTVNRVLGIQLAIAFVALGAAMVVGLTA